VPCVLCLRAAQACISKCRPLGVLMTRQLHLRPFGLVWSCVDDFVRRTWRPRSFVEKFLGGKRNQGDHGDLVASLCGKSKCPRKRLGYREAIVLGSASTTWSRSGFVPNRTTGQISHQEFAFSHPYLSFHISYCNLCAFTFLV